MVLENIVSISDAVRRPWWMFFIGGIVSLISLFVSFVVFPSSVGLFTVFLITFAMTPFMVKLMNYEEEREEQLIKKHLDEGTNFLQRHKEPLLIYTAFFSGMIIFMSLAFLVLPQDLVQKLFEDQINQINIIKGSATAFGTLEKIIVNNIGVLFIAFLFAFLFGSGAIFILAWNASILAAAIGIAAQSIGGVAALPLAILIFFPHGSLEILAYFIGGIAGGLISASFIRKRSQLFPIILKDSLILLAVAVVLLLIAAFVETAIISLGGS